MLVTTRSEMPLAEMIHFFTEVKEHMPTLKILPD